MPPSVEASSRPLGARRRVVFTVAAGVLSLLLAAGALEIVGRLFDPLGVSYYPETAALPRHARPRRADRVPEPARADRTVLPSQVTINALGMRDRELAADPERGEFRVAIMGDSLPFGIGVAYADSIPAAIEGELQSRAPEGVRFRTMNFGVPSYNTEQELVQFDTLWCGASTRAR